MNSSGNNKQLKDNAEVRLFSCDLLISSVDFNIKEGFCNLPAQ